MGALIDGSINLSKLNKDKLSTAKNGDTWYNFTMGVNDDTSDYGDNCGVWNKQTKDERDAKEKKSYTGNGKVVWTDGSIKTAERKEEASVTKEKVTDDLPF